MATRKATLVLSGGGAKGAFQVGAERVLREKYGFDWERIFGVSVGALNGTMLAQRRYDELERIWRTLREEEVHRKYSWLQVAWRVGVQRKLGLYDNAPLRRLIDRHVQDHPFRVEVHVGRVSLVTGRYEIVRGDRPSPEFLDAVWQSATMPIVWEPIGGDAWVDGGLRNITPLADALEFDPTEVVVIVAGPDDVELVPRPKTILEVATRSLTDITLNEILISDTREFVRINELVRQAAGKVELRSPSGEPYRYVPITVVKAPGSLGDTLDFSQAEIARRIQLGEAAAHKAMLPVPVA